MGIGALQPMHLLVLFLIVGVVLIAPLVILILVLVARTRAAGATGAPSPTEMRKCPYCAELVRAEAVVCRYCGRDIGSLNAAQGRGISV